MYSIKIDFPFSNINDENYVLTLYASRNGAFANAIDAMDADTRCFSKKTTQTIDGNVITSYEGTLVGDVIAEDDDREDVFQPLVASKLKFNMACQQFPTWLMDICDYYTNVKVVLCAKSGMINIERWRGYLMANTLNMTVVNEMMACPLVAVDEVGIAKYLKFKENYAPSDATPSLLELFSTYNGAIFNEIYSLLGLRKKVNITLLDGRVYGTNGGVGGSAADYGHIEIQLSDECKYVRFLGLLRKSNDGNTGIGNVGYAFGHYSNGTWITDEAFFYDKGTSTSSRIHHEYVALVPSGSTHFRTTAHFASSLSYSDFYCYEERGNLYMSRDLAYKDNDNSNVVDLMALHVNIERFFIDKESTWGDVIGDVCSYLGVNFCVGAVDNNGNDKYILSGHDYNYNHYLIYAFGATSYIDMSSRLFADLGNQEKVGADLQCTYKPCEWKGVKVKSTPSRPPVHKYLDKDNVKPIEPASGHGEWCETRIGKYRDNTTIDDYKYRVFQYTKIVNKEDQWIDEAEYITMEDCNLASDARTVGMADAYFPLTDSALGHVRPQPEDTDSMDFALSKWGMITARIGSYETPRQKVSADLKDYLVLLNNKWGREYWDSDEPVSAIDYSPELIGTIFPFANDKSIRPDNTSYLSIDFSAIFLNENIGSDVRIVENGSLEANLKGKIQAVFPITESFHDWGSDTEGDLNNTFTGSLVSSAHNTVTSFFPFVIARLSIGNHYWDGSSWVYDDGNNKPTFHLPLIPQSSTEKYYMVNTGYMHGAVNNYYYVECRPRVGASDNVFRVPLAGLSTSSQPLSGQVKLEIFGRVPYFNGWDPDFGDTRYNNILMVLISDIEIKFTDEAYYMEGKDIDTVGKTIVDSASTTKKIKEVNINMTSPTVDGVFGNCMVYDDGQKWVNLQKVNHGDGVDKTMEEILSAEIASVMCNEQVFVEFSRNFNTSTGDLYNVGFTVGSLTEVPGTFMPLVRKFNWTKGTVRLKMQCVS